MNANPLTTVGLMLTLAGLVGSFFNIQLSQWLRDLLGLSQKVEMNKAGGTPEKEKALVECKIELKKLANCETYAINVLVLAFVVFVLGNGLAMIRTSSADPLYLHISTALWVFLVFFVGVSGWLIWRGWYTAKAITSILYPPTSAPGR